MVKSVKTHKEKYPGNMVVNLVLSFILLTIASFITFIIYFAC